jgi:hypothetical protein
MSCHKAACSRARALPSLPEDGSVGVYASQLFVLKPLLSGPARVLRDPTDEPPGECLFALKDMTDGMLPDARVCVSRPDVPQKIGVI